MSDNEKFNAKRAFDVLYNYILTYDRILYSTVSNIIYECNEEGKNKNLFGTILSNVEELVAYTEDSIIIIFIGYFDITGKEVVEEYKVKEFDPLTQDSGRYASDNSSFIMFFGINRIINYEVLNAIPKDVDHFKPKSIYPDLVVKWENLLPSCPHCNKEKSSHDTGAEPIVNPSEDDPREFFYLKDYRYGTYNLWSEITLKTAQTLLYTFRKLSHTLQHPLR